MLATLSEAWPVLTLAIAGLALVVLGNYAAWRAVRRQEPLVRVMAATAMTVATVLVLAGVLVVGAFGVLLAFCAPDAYECPV